MPKISSEREGFSSRLRQALKNAHHSPDSPTELARDFNVRFPGRPITVHAARKWLVGEAIPTQDKMRTLAEWLLVPVDWLRFGGNDERVDVRDAINNIHSEDLKLVADLRLLDERERQIVREFVRIMVRTNHQRQLEGHPAPSVEEERRLN